MNRRVRHAVGSVGLWTLAVVAALAALPLGWAVSDRLEQDNDFCNACHLEPGLPLHLTIRRGFDAEPAGSLAAVHAGAEVEARAESAFRCIDCHGGHDLRSRAKVKVLAAADAFWWLVGHFEEPDHMAWPLEDGACTACHRAFDPSETPEWESPRFHELAVHNVDLGVACVACHGVHAAGGNADAYFLHTEQVRSECARCHAEYAAL